MNSIASLFYLVAMAGEECNTWHEFLLWKELNLLLNVLSRRLDGMPFSNSLLHIII
jgi:hypothetical protein